MAFSRVRGGFVPMLGGKPVVARTPSGKSRAAKRPAQGAVEYVHADGTPVDPGLYKDVVFVKADAESTATGARPRAAKQERAWWSALDAAAVAPPVFQDERRDVVVGDVKLTRQDVDRMLGALSPPRPAAQVDVDPGFFHTTLSRWLGLAPTTQGKRGGGPSGQSGQHEATWDYDFWKAELVEQTEPSGGRDDAALPAAPAHTVARRFTALVYRGESSEPERYAYWIAVDDKGRIKRSAWLTPPPDLLGGAHGAAPAFRDPSKSQSASLSAAARAALRGFDALYDDA